MAIACLWNRFQAEPQRQRQEGLRRGVRVGDLLLGRAAGTAAMRQTFESLFGNLFEAVLVEVAIHGERARNLPPPHDLEARAIHEAQPPPGRPQEILHRGFVALRVDPLDVEERHEDLLGRRKYQRTWSIAERVPEVTVVLDREIRQPGPEPSAQLESTLSEVFLILRHHTGINRAQKGARLPALGNEDALPLPGSLQVLTEPSFQGFDSDFRHRSAVYQTRWVRFRLRLWPGTSGMRSSPPQNMLDADHHELRRAQRRYADLDVQEAVVDVFLRRGGGDVVGLDRGDSLQSALGPEILQEVGDVRLHRAPGRVVVGREGELTQPIFDGLLDVDDRAADLNVAIVGVAGESLGAPDRGAVAGEVADEVHRLAFGRRGEVVLPPVADPDRRTDDAVQHDVRRRVPYPSGSVD